jgi:hypothetical protein
MEIGVTLENGLSAQLIVAEETRYVIDLAPILLQHMVVLIVWVKTRNSNNVTKVHAP